MALALRRVTVQIFGPAGHHGAGVIWRNDGLIVTTSHVVNGISLQKLRATIVAVVQANHRIVGEATASVALQARRLPAQANSAQVS